eukprot:2805840-Pyramimonas_sp.AAC.1
MLQREHARLRSELDQKQKEVDQGNLKQEELRRKEDMTARDLERATEKLTQAQTDLAELRDANRQNTQALQERYAG